MVRRLHNSCLDGRGCRRLCATAFGSPCGSGGRARSVNEPVHDAMINVAGSVAMFGAAHRGGSLEAAVLASSAAVYGVQRTPLAQEEHPIEPISGYGAAKRAAEVYWAQMGRLHGVRTGAALCERVWSRQSPKGEAGVIAILSAPRRRDRR